MPSRLIVSLVFGLAAVSLGGCFVVQEKTFGETLDDTTAGATIKTKLIASGGTSRFGEVDVQIVDRFALLTGRVPSEADRIEAERIAWTISTIDEVANELVIRKFDLGQSVNDHWINSQIRARLLADSDIKGVNYNIEVYDGVAYLLGYARTEEELRQAADHASRVKGVKKVVSYVKMRERAEPQYAEPADQAPVDIAPSSDEPAPIVPPERPPTTRSQYGDPYATGATPPPGASGNSLGLQSLPLPPAQ